MSDIVITAAKQTAVGSFMDAFGSTPAHELGLTASWRRWRRRESRLTRSAKS
ncbi:Acetyl-CoA C-acetyltransferase (plasmid) [Sphingobium sp. EP60837]|nr:Acetyl-CoA C-acetyltransferase [Sphingobium sp. EP60837]